MNNYLIQPETVTIQLKDYLKLKRDAESIDALKKGGVMETSWWHGEYVYYSEKEFNKEIEKRIKRETEVARNLGKVLKELSKKSIFGFLKFKRTFSYTSYP